MRTKRRLFDIFLYSSKVKAVNLTVWHEAQLIHVLWQEMMELNIFPLFQYSKHALGSYCPCAYFSAYVIHLERKQQ